MHMKNAFVALLIALGSIAAQAQTVTVFRVDGVLWGIAAGPDGNVWFPTTNGVARMTPAGKTTTFRTRLPISGRATIAAAPDGRMWFTEPDQSRIGAITMDGVITEYDLPGGIQPLGIAAGNDGVVWFGAVGTIGSIINGSVSVLLLPNAAQPLEMAADVDGSVWFVEYPMNKIGHVKPSIAIIGFDRPFTDVATAPACCLPVSITRGSDGAMWFALDQGDAIARLANGNVTTFTPGPAAIRTVAAGDNRIWYATEALNHPAQIGSISVDGVPGPVVTLPREVARVMSMTVAADGDVWATMLPSPLAIAHVNVNATPHHRAAGRH